MKKKLISLLLTVAMVASIIGTIPVFATGGATPASTPTTGGVLDFTKTPAPTPTGTGYTWANNTLTLNNFTYTSSGANGIILPDGATINLVGTNTLKTVADVEGVNSYGIEAQGDLTITGDGTLAVTSSSTDNNSYGIYSDGAVTIKDKATVTATGGESALSTGIFTRADLTITDATVTATGGYATGEKAGSYGIHSDGALTINGGAKVTATGDTATGDTEAGVSCGIDSMDATITDSTVTAAGGEATGVSYGIYPADLTITDSTVTATGGNVTGEYGSSFGINSGDLTITDSTVTAIGGTGDASYGIYSIDKVDIKTGAKVTATGVEAADASCGIYSYGDLTINGGATVIATASNATMISVGIAGAAIDISDPTNVLEIKSGDAMVSAAVLGGDINIGTASFEIPVGAHVAQVTIPEEQSILSDEEPEEQGPFAIFGSDDADKPAKHVKFGVPIPEIKPSDNKTFKHDRDFNTLENIYFDGQKLKLTDGGANRKYITGYNGVDTVYIGEVTRGSVIITMYPQFLRTLPLGTYTVALTFKNSATGVPAEEDVIQQFTLVADKTTNFPSYPSYPSYGGGYYGSSATTATTYNVTLNLFDGATETVKTEDGNIVKLPANPIREGYVFLGWYTDKELTKMVAPDTRITANTTIYARWHKTVEMPTVTEPTEVPQTSDSWFKF